MTLLPAVLDTTGMILFALIVVTQIIVPLWFGKKMFWLFRGRSAKAEMEILPPKTESKKNGQP